MSSNRIGWAFFLNLGFTIIEFIGGWLTNSTAIMSDAVHDLGDTLSIGSAWVLNKLGKKQANSANSATVFAVYLCLELYSTALY